jgi:hypothetical protein
MHCGVHLQAGITHLQQRPMRTAAKALLMLLQLTAGPSAAVAPAAVAGTATPTAAAQLLELMGCAAASGGGVSASSGSRAVMARVMPCSDAFSQCCLLLQLSAGAPGAEAWEAGQLRSGGGGDGPLGCEPAGSGLACRAAAFLLECYGHDGVRSCSAAAGDSLSDYDACMVWLVASMAAGPGGAAAAAGGASGGAKRRGTRGGGSLEGGSEEARLLAWAGSAGFRALAEVVAGHPRWDVLACGLVRAVELEATQDGAAAAQGAAGAPPGRGAGAAAAAAALRRVRRALRVLFEVARAAAGAEERTARTAALLRGLSALTRPEAMCCAEWRAEALGEMELAVTAFVEDHPGKHC